MWAIGINQTTAILFGLPRSEGGYGFSYKALGFLSFTPIVAVIIGEILGHHGNDWITRVYTRVHGGIFKPEGRLMAIYPADMFMCAGLILVGQALAKHLHWVALAFGWAMYVGGYMVVSVAITAHALDAYPNAPGEVSTLINLSRILGGFAVGYFELEWGLKEGFDVSFGIQAAIVAASVPIIVILHVYGERLRAKGGKLAI